MKIENKTMKGVVIDSSAGMIEKFNKLVAEDLELEKMTRQARQEALKAKNRELTRIKDHNRKQLIKTEKGINL